MAAKMSRQDIIDMTLDFKLEVDMNLRIGAVEFASCGACDGLYPKAYDSFTEQYCVPCHLEKRYGIIAEEVLEEVDTLTPKTLPAGLHEVTRQPRGHGLY